MANHPAEGILRRFDPGRIAEIALIFARVSLATFGSGNTTSAKLRDELVERRGWLGPSQFALSFALARLTPGTNLLAFCSAAGWYLRGMRGAAAALIAVSLPASAVTVLLTLAYLAWHKHPLGSAAIAGAMAAVVGVILGGVALLIRAHAARREWPRAAVLVAFGFIAAYWLNWTPLAVICAAAASGYFWKEPGP